MREKLMLSAALFGLLALMQSAGNCEELKPSPTSKGQSLETNTTTYSTALSSYDTHSISKRETKDKVINALTGVGILFTTEVFLTTGFPPEPLALGLFASVAQLGSLFHTLIASNSEKIPGRTLSRTQLLQKIKSDAAEYNEEVTKNLEALKAATPSFHINSNEYFPIATFFVDYEPLKQAFVEFVKRPRGPQVKDGLLAAANKTNIRKIINGIETYMVKQNPFNAPPSRTNYGIEPYMVNQTAFSASLIKTNYSGETFAAWTGAARTYLYEMIIIKALTFGILAKQNNQKITNATVKAELKPFMDTANSIMDRMFKLGRKLYWENDIEKHMSNEMNNWYEGKGSFGRAMSKYVKYGEQHIVVGLSSREMGFSCSENGKHHFMNRMPNATENMRIFTLLHNMPSHYSSCSPEWHFCMTIYIIRVTQNVTGKRKLPDYVKFVGKNYGDAVTQLDKEDRRFSSNDTAVFGGVLMKSNDIEYWGLRQCYFDLARFTFQPPSLIERVCNGMSFTGPSYYNNITFWPPSDIPHGLLIAKNTIPYPYDGEECYVDTLAIC